MTQYRKKPVVIDAFQMTIDRRMDNSSWPLWLDIAWNYERGQKGSLQRVSMDATLPDQLEIVTQKGNQLVSWRDWIIRDVHGDMYTCKPHIFAAMYEAA